MTSGGLRIKGKIKQYQENASVITVITVVRNGKNTLEKTILSIINQTYTNIEYIIIDGASNDGTLDIIRKYEGQIDYWISEPDQGIYDAMNKGIDLATGEWINFMNSGDSFPTVATLDNIFRGESYENIDIIYGNSIEKNETEFIQRKIKKNISKLNDGAIYRHGASFVKGIVHKQHKFDLTKYDTLGFALDFDCIYHLYKTGKVFRYVDTNFCIYEKNGISNDPLKITKYNYIITSQYGFSFFNWVKYILRLIKWLIISKTYA